MAKPNHLQGTRGATAAAAAGDDENEKIEIPLGWYGNHTI